MASGILVTPEQLQTISVQLTNGSNEIQNILATLATAVVPLESDWTGTAASQFEALYEEWKRDAAGLQEALTSIAQLTAQAAQAYATTEQSIASSFTPK